jgi:hypothetical protein
MAKRAMPHSLFNFVQHPLENDTYLGNYDDET